MLPAQPSQILSQSWRLEPDSLAPKASFQPRRAKVGPSEAAKCQRRWKDSGHFLWRFLLTTFGVSLSFAKPSNISFLDHFCLPSVRPSTANYSMSCLSNGKAFVPLALRLIGLCGLPESRCYIIDAVSLFSVYRQYMNKLPPLWHKPVWMCVCFCVWTQHAVIFL